MKNKLLLVVFLLPLFLHAQNQRAIIQDQDTVVVFPSDEQNIYKVEIRQEITPTQLHFLTDKHYQYSFFFGSDDDLKKTMWKYYTVDGDLAVPFKLTPNEKQLLRQYGRIVNNESRSNVSTEESFAKQPNEISWKVSDHLSQAGIYKNTSIVVILSALGIQRGLISADSSNLETANAIAISGSIVAVILNVAGNFQLIKAGRKLEKELSEEDVDSNINL